MNKPFTLPIAYEHDVYGWAQQQAMSTAFGWTDIYASAQALNP